MFDWNPGTEIFNLIQGMIGIWNDFVALAMDYLGLDIEQLSKAISKEGSSISVVLKTLEDNLFEPVACGLVVIFFLWNFIGETIDIRDKLKLYKFFISLGKICLAQVCICYAREIVSAIMQIGINIVDLITTSGMVGNLKVEIHDANTYADVLGDMSFFPALFLLILAFIAVIIVLGCSIIMVYTVISRFIKIFILIPFGILGFSTIVGGREMSASSKAFIKYIILTVLEGVLIVVTLKITSVWNGIGLEKILNADFKATGTIFDGIVWILDTMLPMVMTVGLVKTAQSLLGKALAL